MTPMTQTLRLIALLTLPAVVHAQPSPGDPAVDAAKPAPAADGPADPAGPADPSLDDEEEDEDEGVRIVGNRDQLSRMGGSAQVVGKKALEAFEYDDVHRALDGVPGVYVRDEDGEGLRPNIGLRGTSSERSAKITLMEDGILLAPAPYAAPAAYYFPLTTRMVGVEVFKGPAAIAYGPNTVGGAINLVTRSIPRGAKGEVDVSTGRFGNDKTHAWGGWSDDRFGILLEWAQIDGDGFKTLDSGGPTGFNKREGMLKLRWQSAPTADNFHRLQLKVGWSDEVSNETYLGLTQSDFNADPFRRYAASGLGQMDWWRSQAQLAYTFEAGEALHVRAVAYRHDFERSWLKLNSIRGRPALRDLLNDPTGTQAIDAAVLRGDEDSDARNPLLIGTNARSFFAQGVEVNSRYTLKTEEVTQTFRVGLRVHQDQIRRDHDEAAFDMVRGALLRASPDEFTTRNTETALAFSGHMLDEVQLGTRLVITPGARIEIIQTDFEDRQTGIQREDSQAAVLPGLGAVYRFTPEFSVLGGVHRGFTPVSPRSGDLADPESSFNFEAGTRYLSETSRAEVIGFYNLYDNLLVACTASAGCLPDDIGRQFNGGALDVYGAEVALAHAFRVAKGLRMQADLSYTLTLSDFQSAFVDPILGPVSPGDALPYLPMHQGRVSLGAWMGPVSINTALRYVGEMRDVAGQGTIPTVEQVPDRLVLDIAAQWQVWDSLRAYARVDNATNRTYIASRRPYGLRPGKPIAFTVGVKYAVSQ